MPLCLLPIYFPIICFMLLLPFPSSIASSIDATNLPAHKKLEKLNNLEFALSRNYFYSAPVKYKSAKMELNYVGVFVGRINEPNIHVKFFMLKGSLRCSYTHYKPAQQDQFGSIFRKPDKNGTFEKSCKYTETKFCLMNVNRGTSLLLPPNTMFYSPKRYRQPTNYREILEALNPMSVHDAMQTCASAFLFQGSPTDNKNALFLRDDWLLYLLEGKLICNTRWDSKVGALARGYTVSLVQYNRDFHANSNHTMCEAFARLCAYSERGNREGEFLLAGILGSARLSKYEHVNLNMRNISRQEARKQSDATFKQWETCAHNYAERLHDGQGNYLLQLQVSHFCDDNDEGRQPRAQTLNFKIELDPTLATSKAIYHYKEQDTKARAEVDLLKGKLKMPDGKIINGFADDAQKVPNWPKPGVKYQDFDKPENNAAATKKREEL